MLSSHRVPPCPTHAPARAADDFFFRSPFFSLIRIWVVPPLAVLLAASVLAFVIRFW